MPRGENRPSVLLSREENEQVFSLIGPKCQSLATAVVQLFTTEGPGHTEWKKKDTGVLCLIKDNSKRSYFFRIYCLYRKTMIWEHEVYMQIEYKSPRPYLHTFEAEEYMTAFNFANEDEARALRNILIEKIELRKQRREERRQRSMLAARANSSASSTPNLSARVNGVSHTPPPAPTPAPAPAPAPAPPMPTKANSISGGGYTLKGKKPKTRKLTKADIGAPKDFKHVSHVGWDANKGFDVENLPEAEMRSFLLKAGISEKQLQDHATRQFIYDFINTHGGVDAVKEELHDSPKEMSPAPTPAPPVPSRAPHALPPAPPSRAPPPPPARAVPPPPPPPASLQRQPPPRPHPPTTAPPSVPPPPPPSTAPPPPPPPPIPSSPAAPPAPAPPPPPPPPDTADPRAELMESIRSGNKNLRHVEVAAKPAANEDSRSNLLSEIRQGINLRAVNRPVKEEVVERAPACGLAGALAKALQERARAIHSSDSEDSQTTSDGEWDD